VSSSRIRLSGIRAEGRHGASPGEKDRPQEFVVDLDVEVDVAGDSLTGTADYRVVVDTVRAVVSGRSVVLLESLAQAVAEAIQALDSVRTVTVVVHKPSAAEGMKVRGVSASVSVGG
jgi:dihydroneopterin aldolase